MELPCDARQREEMKAKHQRLTLVLLAIGAVGGASVLALSALKDQAAFF